MHRRKVLIVLSVVGLTVLAGCSSVASGPDYSVSDPDFVVEDGEPKLVFDYNASDYATVLVEAPNGEIVQEKKLNPNETAGDMSVSEFQSGEYRLVLREGGDTVADTRMNVSGPSVQTERVSTDWSENTFKRASIVLNNTGDIPVRIDAVTAQVAGETITSHESEWLAPGSSTTAHVAPPSDYVTVESSGTLYGKVDVETSEGEVSDGFSKQFEGGNLTVDEINPVWDGATLKSVKVDVTNDGDLPASANIAVRDNGEELASSTSETVAPGDTVEFTDASFSYVHKYESGGEKDVTVVLNSSSGFSQQTFTNRVEPANISIEPMSTIWDSGTLNEVAFVVKNSGEVPADIDYSLTIAGENIDEGSARVDPSSNETITIESSYLFDGGDGLYTADGGEEVSVEVSISTDEQTANSSETKTFGDVDAEINKVDPMFTNQYDSSKVELTSVDFQVRNTGDITLTYDTVEIEIGGSTRTINPYLDQRIEPGAENLVSEVFTDGIVVEPGEYEMTVRVLDGGEVVFTDKVTITAERTGV